jgi:hypothetical protein
MTIYQHTACADEARRNDLKDHATLNGIDYIEVSPDQETLYVHLVNDMPADSYGLLDSLDRIEIEGGVRICSIKLEGIRRASPRLLEIDVSEPGDFSTYTLAIDSKAFDPVYARCDFSFKAGCPSRFDCRSRPVCPSEPRAEPLIDYMAKDYASFRQALIDRIPLLVPDWKDRHAADLGMALVELLAYTGDQLSYYQDAVANEAYLETARQRISVRRHAHLIDYPMHDGASARVLVHVQVSAAGTLPAGTQILSRIEQPLPSATPPHGSVLSGKAAQAALEIADAVFETFADVEVHPELNRVSLYTWGNRECCLPRGATSADLKGDLSGQLSRGALLLFEEVIGPETGLAADADPTHRHVVRLTDVALTSDPLKGEPVTRITWDRADALPFPLCLSTRKDELTTIEDVSVARGNLVLADHGRRIAEWHPGDPADPSVAGIEPGPRAYRFFLKEGPLSFRILAPKGNGAISPARMLLSSDPQQARPVVALEIDTEAWEPVVPHLLDSQPFHSHFAVETDNDGRALIRFGDGTYGAQPPAGSHIRAAYRVGVGAAGNVGAETLVHLIRPAAAINWPNITGARNPLAAWGGIDPEPVEQVQQLAPAAFHAEQFRAVIEADYARAATKHPEVARAVATFRWTGSWHTVFITIDPLGRTDVDAALERRVRNWVTRYTLAGYDLEIDPPIFVPLEIEIDVCVAPTHFRAHVEEAVLAVLSSRRLPDGSRGFFHPDAFTFGQPLYASRLYAAVEAVDGVDSAVIRRFIRRTTSDPDPNRPATRKNLKRSYLPVGRLEIIRLDNDPSLPENGVLRLNMLGGK